MNGLFVANGWGGSRGTGMEREDRGGGWEGGGSRGGGRIRVKDSLEGRSRLSGRA